MTRRADLRIESIHPWSAVRTTFLLGLDQGRNPFLVPVVQDTEATGDGGSHGGSLPRRPASGKEEALRRRLQQSCNCSH